MRTTKEAELTIAIFRYIAQCLDEGDFTALNHLGLNRADAEAVGALALADLDPIAASRFPLLKPEAVNRALVHRLVAHAKAQRTLKGVRDALLARDAPLPMMRRLFGMDSSEYAERGRAFVAGAPASKSCRGLPPPRLIATWELPTLPPSVKRRPSFDPVRAHRRSRIGTSLSPRSAWTTYSGTSCTSLGDQTHKGYTGDFPRADGWALGRPSGLQLFNLAGCPPPGPKRGAPLCGDPVPPDVFRFEWPS